MRREGCNSDRSLQLSVLLFRPYIYEYLGTVENDQLNSEGTSCFISNKIMLILRLLRNLSY